MNCNNNVPRKVEDRGGQHRARRARHIYDTCTGQNRVEPSFGGGTHLTVVYTTRTILAKNQITPISKMVDIQTNKEAVVGGVAHVET